MVKDCSTQRVSGAVVGTTDTLTFYTLWEFNRQKSEVWA